MIGARKHLFTDFEMSAGFLLHLGSNLGSKKKIFKLVNSQKSKEILYQWGLLSGFGFSFFQPQNTLHSTPHNSHYVHSNLASIT